MPLAQDTRLGALSLSDVDHRAEHLGRLIVLIPEYLGGCGEPADLAAGTNYAKFDVVGGGALESGANRLADALTVVRMNEAGKIIQGAAKSAAFDS